MAFRISDATIFNRSVRSTQMNRLQLAELQAQLSSGKRINSLGDDPSDAARILNLRRADARIEQFERNIDTATARLEPAEQAMASLTDLFTRLRELAVSADQEEEQFDLIKAEVEQRFHELVSLANSHYNDDFLFGGFGSGSAPFSTAGAFTESVVDIANPSVTYNGDSGVMQIQVGEDSRIDVNVPGASLFQGDFDGDGSTDVGRVNLFDLVRDLRNRLEDPNAPADPTFGANPGPLETIDDIDTALEQILQLRGSIGARLNRLESTANQLQSVKITLEGERTAIEDLDIIKAATDLQSKESAYQTSLAVTARVIQRSLLDFLS